MTRTAGRPIPSGRVEAETALALGLGLSVLSVAMLGLFANPLAAALLAFTIFFYAVIYSMWLKRRTAQNIVIGGAAGALPPVIGWAAVSGDVSATPLILFTLIFLWTPPHFWALALFRSDDYARVGVPMLPVTAGDGETRRQIWLYTLVLTPAAIAPAFTSAGGPVYLIVSLAVSGWFLKGAHAVWRRDAEAAAADRYRAEKKLFGISIVYLFALFIAVLVEGLIAALFGDLGWPRFI